MKLLPLLFLLVSASDSSYSRESSGSSDMDVESFSLSEESPADAFRLVSRRDLMDYSFSPTDALILTLSLGDPDACDQALEDPHNLTDLSANNNSVLNYALKHCSKPVIIKVLARVDPSANDDALLKSLCAEGDFKTVSYILCDPRVDPTRKEYQALIEAASHGHVNVFNLLLADSRVSMENPFVQVALNLAISGLEIDQTEVASNLSLMLQFKKTLLLPEGVIVDAETILAIGQLAANHGLMSVIDQIQWLLVSNHVEIQERQSVFEVLTRYSASRGLDEVVLNLLGQAHSLSDLDGQSIKNYLLQACRFDHPSTVYVLLDFAKAHSYMLLQLVDSTLESCLIYGRHVMAKHILEAYLGLTFNTTSKELDNRLAELLGHTSIVYYIETLLKLRLVTEWAELTNSIQLPAELVNNLFFLSLDQ